MRKTISSVITVLALGACDPVPHVPAAPRSNWAEGFTVVRIDSSCSESDPFARTYLHTDSPIPPDVFPPIVWEPDRSETGVIISENRVLTAEHGVRCPIIPQVEVTTQWGRYQMVVAHDDFIFGKGTDYAQLEMSSAEWFAVGVSPPALSLGGSKMWCAETLHGRTCGRPLGGAIFDAPTRPGDSGAPVYDDVGRLVGLVEAGDGHVTQIIPADPSWLAGT